MEATPGELLGIIGKQQVVIEKQQSYIAALEAEYRRLTEPTPPDRLAGNRQQKRAAARSAKRVPVASAVQRTDTATQATEPGASGDGQKQDVDG